MPTIFYGGKIFSGERKKDMYSEYHCTLCLFPDKCYFIAMTVSTDMTIQNSSAVNRGNRWLGLFYERKKSQPFIRDIFPGVPGVEDAAAHEAYVLVLSTLSCLPQLVTFSVSSRTLK